MRGCRRRLSAACVVCQQVGSSRGLRAVSQLSAFACASDTAPPPHAPPPGIEEFDEQVDIYLGATTQKEKIKEEAVLQVQIKKLMRVRDRA